MLFVECHNSILKEFLKCILIKVIASWLNNLVALSINNNVIRHCIYLILLHYEIGSKT